MIATINNTKIALPRSREPNCSTGSGSTRTWRNSALLLIAAPSIWIHHSVNNGEAELPGDLKEPLIYSSNSGKTYDSQLESSETSRNYEDSIFHHIGPRVEIVENENDAANPQDTIVGPKLEAAITAEGISPFLQPTDKQNKQWQAFQRNLDNRAREPVPETKQMSFVTFGKDNNITPGMTPAPVPRPEGPAVVVRPGDTNDSTQGRQQHGLDVPRYMQAITEQVLRGKDSAIRRGKDSAIRRGRGSAIRCGRGSAIRWGRGSATPWGRRSAVSPPGVTNGSNRTFSVRRFLKRIGAKLRRVLTPKSKGTSNRSSGVTSSDNSPRCSSQPMASY